MLYNCENPHGGDVYKTHIALDFSANTNPFGTPDGVKAAAAACLDRLACYPDPYCRRLVSAIAAHENVPERFVLCGAGAAELIYAFAAAERPGIAVEPAPTFAEYSLPLFDAEIRRFALREEDGFRVTDAFADFISKTKPDTVFLCNPNNPTGSLAAPETVERIADACRKIGARLFLDECFMDLADARESFVPRLPEYPNVIVLKAFTKSYGMAGLRLGYCLCADEKLLSGMSRAVQPWSVSTPAQEAGIAALKETAFLEKTCALIKSERPRLAAGLKAIGFTVYDSNANFLLFRGEKGLDKRLLEKGVQIRNCANFSGLSEGFYRVAVRLPEENQKLLELIGER